MAEQYCVQYSCSGDVLAGQSVVSVSLAASIDDRPGSDSQLLPLQVPDKCTTAAPALKPDGTRLAAIYNCEGATGIVLTDPDGRNAEMIPLPVRQFMWRPDGGGLYYVEQFGRRISLLTLPNKQQISLLTANAPSSIGKLSVTPDGALIFNAQNAQNESDLFFLNLKDPAPAADRLTRDGVNAL
jgi:hypothetical protein